jgi:hypothetical protein
MKHLVQICMVLATKAVTRLIASQSIAAGIQILVNVSPGDAAIIVRAKRIQILPLVLESKNVEAVKKRDRTLCAM